jgi:hypothetical protein
MAPCDRSCCWHAPLLRAGPKERAKAKKAAAKEKEKAAAKKGRAKGEGEAKKAPRAPSAYNLYMKAEIQTLKDAAGEGNMSPGPPAAAARPQRSPQ